MKHFFRNVSAVLLITVCSIGTAQDEDPFMFDFERADIPEAVSEPDHTSADDDTALPEENTENAPVLNSKGRQFKELQIGKTLGVSIAAVKPLDSEYEPKFGLGLAFDLSFTPTFTLELNLAGYKSEHKEDPDNNNSLILMAGADFLRFNRWGFIGGGIGLTSSDKTEVSEPTGSMGFARFTIGYAFKTTSSLADEYILKTENRLAVRIMAPMSKEEDDVFVFVLSYEIFF